MTLGVDVIRILAIDQARLTGYAVFENDSLIDYGCIELGRKTDSYENILIHARCKIKNLITELKPDLIAIEDIQQQNRNVSTFKKLAMLMGVLICLFDEIKIPFRIMPPSCWKSFCKIKGRKRVEQKEYTMEFVKMQFGLDDITEDMADAISIGYYAVNNQTVDE